MGYFLIPEAEKAPPANSLVTPKTHTPGPRLQERGSRFNSPTLGRWLNRDPIGIEGGEANLFVFVANHPVSGIDPVGNSEFSLTLCDPKKGEGANWQWSTDMADTELGLTDPISITVCNCPLIDTTDKSKGCNLSCRFGVVQVITLNANKFDKNDLSKKGELRSQSEDGGPIVSDFFTPAEAYGHEQRHVAHILETTKTVMKQWYDQEEAKLKGATLSSCEARRQTIVADAMAYFSKHVKTPESKHPGIPKDLTPYDPLGNNFPKPQK